MNNSIYKTAEANLNKLGISINEIEKLYPKIYETFMPLSTTGVSARTFMHWKELGLVDSPTSKEVKKSWVRINLVEYVWLKIIQVMRDFGVPLKVIRQTKEMMFSNALDVIVGDRTGYFNFLETESNMTSDKVSNIKELVASISAETENSPDELDINVSFIGSLVTNLLLMNDATSIIITKDNEKYDVNCFSHKTMLDFQNFVYPLFELPNFQIPIKKLVEDFFDDPKSEKFVGAYELLSLKEKKVIEAIRKKDFKSITIKQEGKGESIIIDVEKDGDIMDQKAKEIRRILGLNEYSEVTIKYRNDKHLYFKNKTRL